MLNALIHSRSLLELLLEPEAQFTRGEDIGVVQELRKVYLSEFLGAFEGINAGTVYFCAIRAGIISRGHLIVAARRSCGIIRIGTFFGNHFRAVGGEFVVALGAVLGEFYFDALSVTEEWVEVFAVGFRLVREFEVFAVERLACGVGGDSPNVAESQ